MKRFVSIIIAAMLLISCCALADDAGVTLTVALGSQFTTLDPSLNTETVNSHPLRHMFAHLFIADADNVAHPELVDTYTVSDDGLNYTFNLKKGMLWSDGVEITANDFVYGYLRTLSFGADNAWAANNMTTYIEGAKDYQAAALAAGPEFDCTTADYSAVGVSAPDDYTLVLKLCKPCAYLPNLLCGNAWGPQRPDVMPQHESLWAFEPGYPTTGAYTLAECNPMEKAVLVKNPNYYGADKVTVEQLTYLVMTDASAEELAFKTGEIDIATTITAETAVAYLEQPELRLVSSPVNYFLAINSGSTGPEWAKNVNVRKALNYAIDKDMIVEILGGPALRQTLNGYVPYGLAGVSGDFREEGDAMNIPFTYDPEMAKTLLAQEGYDESNPLTIKYKYSNSGIHGDVATTLQAMWKAVGVNVELIAVESGVFYDQLDQGDFEISRYGYSAGDDVMQFFELWTTGMQIVAAVDDPVYDKMCDDCCYITDPAAYYTELHNIENYFYAENCYVIPLFTYGTQELIPANIKGIESHGAGDWLASVTFD